MLIFPQANVPFQSQQCAAIAPLVFLRKPLAEQSSPPVLLADMFGVNQSAHTLLELYPSNFMTNF